MLNIAASEAVVDPKEAAEYAGLVYVTDETSGIRRKRARKGFRYEDEARRAPVRGKAILGRIRTLAIPPAWTDVWICPKANGHLLVR
jgi:DNA topoisomerase-1